MLCCYTTVGGNASKCVTADLNVNSPQKLSACPQHTTCPKPYRHAPLDMHHHGRSRGSAQVPGNKWVRRAIDRVAAAYAPRPLSSLPHRITVAVTGGGSGGGEPRSSRGPTEEQDGEGLSCPCAVSVPPLPPGKPHRARRDQSPPSASSASSESHGGNGETRRTQGAARSDVGMRWAEGESGRRGWLGASGSAGTEVVGRGLGGGVLCRSQQALRHLRSAAAVDLSPCSRSAQRR